MVRGSQPEMVRRAPKVLVQVVVLTAVISGVAAAPFTIIANVNSETMVHMGDGVFFPQPVVSVKCPELPGLQCRSKVDGHQIIINVFHNMEERESIESTEETIVDDKNHISPWWTSEEPNRVVEKNSDISESAELSKTVDPTMKSEEEQHNEEEYDTSRQSVSMERENQNPSADNDEEMSTDNENSSQYNKRSEEYDDPNERKNDSEPNSNYEERSRNDDNGENDSAQQNYSRNEDTTYNEVQEN